MKKTTRILITIAAITIVDLRGLDLLRGIIIFNRNKTVKINRKKNLFFFHPIEL